MIWNGAPAPKSEMKPMKGTLTEKNVWEIVNYIRSIGPRPQPEGAAQSAHTSAERSRRQRTDSGRQPRLPVLRPSNRDPARRLPGLAREHRGVHHCARQRRRSVEDFIGRHERDQPVEFPHNVHVGKEIGCTDYCHEAVTTGPVAGLPSVRTCMICHNAIATDRPRIRQITAMRERGEDFVLAPRVRLHAGGARPLQSRAAHPREGRLRTCHGPIGKGRSPSATSI